MVFSAKDEKTLYFFFWFPLAIITSYQYGTRVRIQMSVSYFSFHTFQARQRSVVLLILSISVRCSI